MAGYLAGAAGCGRANGSVPSPARTALARLSLVEDLAQDGEPRLSRMRKIGAAAPDRGHLPLGLRFRERNVANGGPIESFGRHPRQKGNAQADGDKFDRKVDLARARGDGWLESAAMASFQDNSVQGEPCLKQDKGNILEVEEVNGSLTRQRVIRRNERH